MHYSLPILSEYHHKSTSASLAFHMASILLPSIPDPKAPLTGSYRQHSDELKAIWQCIGHPSSFHALKSGSVGVTRRLYFLQRLGAMDTVLQNTLHRKTSHSNHYYSRWSHSRHAASGRIRAKQKTNLIARAVPTKK